MKVKLYTVPASHPSAAVERALELKGLDYERVDLLPLAHMAVQRARFGQRSVPGVVIDGEKVVGSRRILERLDAIAPEPPLRPADPDRRARIDELERWGDEVLQQAARRITWASLRRAPKSMMSFAEGADLPLPDALIAPSAPLVARAEAAIWGANEQAVRADLGALPGWLDQVDGWIEEGLLGSERPNAADLQIGSSIQLLGSFGDIRPLLAGRPCEALAQRVFGDPPGDVPAGALPADWLPAAAQAPAA